MLCIRHSIMPESKSSFVIKVVRVPHVEGFWIELGLQKALKGQPTTKEGAKVRKSLY